MTYAQPSILHGPPGLGQRAQFQKIPAVVGRGGFEKHHPAQKEAALDGD